MFLLPSPFLCFFNDTTHLLPLLFLSWLFLLLTFSFRSRSLQYALSSPLPLNAYASVLHSAYPSILSFDFEVALNKIKTKSRKEIKHYYWPDHSSIHSPAKPSSSSLANSLRGDNRSHSGNTPGVGKDFAQLSWPYLKSLAQRCCCAPWSQALLSLYNIKNA